MYITAFPVCKIFLQISSANISTASWTFITGILNSLPGATQPSLYVLYAGDIVQSGWLFSKILKFLVKNLHSKEFNAISAIFQVTVFAFCYARTMRICFVEVLF